MDKVQADHSGGDITDYEDDFREHTEDEDEDEAQDEGDYPNTQGENASFLLLLSQNGNESDDNYGKSETGVEKERKESSGMKEATAKKQTNKTVKDSTVGG